MHIEKLKCDYGWGMHMAKKMADINQRICAACGVCAGVCPKGAIEIWRGCYAQVSKDICVGCGLCAKACPAGCISVKERGKQDEDQALV